MATYEEIRRYAQEKYGFTPKNTWIASAKVFYGLKTERACNRKDDTVKWPCPQKHLAAFKEIFEHFDMI